MNPKVILQGKQISTSADNWICADNWIARANNNEIISNMNHVNVVAYKVIGRKLHGGLMGLFFGQINHSRRNTYAKVKLKLFVYLCHCRKFLLPEKLWSFGCWVAAPPPGPSFTFPPSPTKFEDTCMKKNRIC